jgi:DNA-binding MarR family transcriptional regulator
MDRPCTCSRVRRSLRILTGVYDGALAPSGLTTAQFSLLRTLARLGPSSISALAEATAHERSSLSRTLRPLEARGLVALEAGRDQRERRVALTDAGKKAIADAMPLWREAQGRVDDLLGEEGQRLVSLLERTEDLRA